ncbi:MAG TPA: GNAT family N-acetyltransferase [Candidatus Acidoferrales bacterium]|nr:GNAT family N-acetyltransferase [Candidatus Acidoferrales bacterium]
MRTLRTKRLRLEPVTPSNAEALWNVLQQPDLRDFQDLPDLDLPQFVRTVTARPTRLEPGISGRFEWLVYGADGQSGAPLGWVSLRIAERAFSSAEVGYSIVREQRGRGFATEAVAALVEEGFRSAGLRRIRAYCVPENASSRSVLRRNGFQDDGMLPHGATVQGHPVDVIAFSLERDRWKSNTTSRPATRS